MMEDGTLAHDSAAVVSNENEGSLIDVEEHEQYRLMAQMEATIRVKDNTGYDRDEYLEQQQQQQRLQLQEDQARCGRGKYGTKPKAQLLPEGERRGNATSDHPSQSSKSTRPEEPPLPFTRANRRYNLQSGKSSSNSHQNARDRVPELCKGVVVPEPSATTTTTTTEAAASTKREHILACWGCGIYLEVNTLATLLQCPECFTISPVMPSPNPYNVA